MPGLNPICLRNNEGMTTQPLEETVTIVEFKEPIKPPNVIREPEKSITIFTDASTLIIGVAQKSLKSI